MFSTTESMLFEQLDSIWICFFFECVRQNTAVLNTMNNKFVFFFSSINEMTIEQNRLIQWQPVIRRWLSQLSYVKPILLSEKQFCGYHFYSGFVFLFNQSTVIFAISTASVGSVNFPPTNLVELNNGDDTYLDNFQQTTGNLRYQITAPAYSKVVAVCTVRTTVCALYFWLFFFKFLHPY